MEKGKYRIRTLARFQADLLQITDYIANVLGNASAADRLVDHVVSSIRKRAENPLSFEAVQSVRDRQHPYYRIYVDNYIVFYSVNSQTKIVTIVRIFYGGRDVKNITVTEEQ